MLTSILDDLKCTNCNGKLELDVIKGYDECIEGFLYCKCNSYPIIDGIAIIVDNIVEYFSNRRRVLGYLLTNTNGKMLKYLRNIARSLNKEYVNIDRYENNALSLYNFIDMSFYKTAVDIILDLDCKECLEIGAGNGILTNMLADKVEKVIGIDKSFNMIKQARKNRHKNAEFIVADLFSLPFRRFDTVIAVNIIDLFNPEQFIKSIRNVINDKLVLIDPYDFRDKNGESINSYDGKHIRRMLEENGFKISENTSEERYLPWFLRINSRAYMLYFADIIVARLI